MARNQIDNADDERPGESLFYRDADDFIRHLVSLRLADDTSEFPAVFDVIERLSANANLTGTPQPGVLPAYVYWQRRRAFDFAFGESEWAHADWDAIDLST